MHGSDKSLTIMTRRTLFVRFFVVYLTALFLAAIILAVLGFERSTGINIVLFAISSGLSYSAYAKRRTLSALQRERNGNIGGFVVIDASLQIVLGSLAMAMSPEGIPWPMIVSGIVFVALVHGATAYLVMRGVERRLDQKGDHTNSASPASRITGL